MGGGLLQLITVGQIDEFLSINPELSFYQYVYKRHTNFAMESRQLMFQKNPQLLPESVSNTVECTISRYGDLLGEVYFCFTLPAIYSSDKYRFKWVQHVGAIAVKKASVFIDGLQIDTTTGEWMNVWNELSTKEGDSKYEEMIGSVPEFMNPRIGKDRVTIRNNKFIYYYYPESSRDGDSEPSIKSRKIIVPLKFWFTKTPALALPLLRLQFNIVTIKIELESSENLYQVFSDKLGMYVSPIYYNQLHNDNITLNTFTKEYTISPYIEANYIFLGEEERNTIFLRSKLTYMVEQLSINASQMVSSQSSASHNINIMVNNPTKEIIWVTRRDDYVKFNDHMNFSPDIPETNRSILDKAIIRFYNNNRIEEKSSEYFNMIQPYQHHSRIPKQGIYSYSFAIYPEKEFLSGYYNSALVKTNLYLYAKYEYNNDVINNKLNSIGFESYLFNYLVNIYTINYNIFEIIGSQVSMRFDLSP